MITKWRNLPLHFKLHIPIQLTLLIFLPFAHIWVMNQFEEKMLEDVRARTQGSATQSLLGLNAMMLSGTIGNPSVRSIFLQKMSTQHGIEDFHLVRSEAVTKQFGSGLSVEWLGDEVDQLAEKSKTVQFHVFTDEKKLRVVTPFLAERDYFGTDCLQCHTVPEGTTLGTVSLTVNLADDYKKLEQLSHKLVTGQVFLQLILLFFIGWLIRNVTRSVGELGGLIHDAQISGNFSMRAQVAGTDEIGQIAHVFNRFLTHIEELHHKLAGKISALETYYDQTEEELRIGSDIMARITDAHSTHDPAVRMTIDPAAHYSGDIILVSRTPSDTLHIMLADAVGHGLIAAMNLLPLSQIFNAMSKKGFPISRIAEELNMKIHRLMPVDRFICAAIVSIDFRNRVVEVWNGGIPSPLLVSVEGAVLHQWKSRYLPLGILDGKSFSSEVEVFHYEDDCQLFLFSDGLPEAESAQGEQFGKERIVQLVQSTDPDYRFDVLLRSLGTHLNGHAAHDDVSLAVANLSLAQDQSLAVQHSFAPQKESANTSHWKLTLDLEKDELRYLDAIPLLTQIVSKIHATAEHHASLYVILSELFNNALEHGLLKLDSSIKQGPDGFEEYLNLRESKLASLSGGSIEIEIEKAIIEGQYGVKIRVADSGEGFDVSKVQSNTLDQIEQAQHGRGIALARSLAHKLEYSQRGNEAIAYYVCS